MDLGIKGKTAIVTGAASNIGRMIALTLAKEGANVAIFDLDAEGAEMVAKEVEALGVKALPVKCNVTNYDEVKASVKKVADEWKTVDILVNDAASFQYKVFTETTPEDWDREIHVNYYGTIHCTRAVLDYMMKQNSGRIISIGSDAGRIGENRQSVYSGTKGAIMSFTKAMCQEIGRYGITMNVVCPGGTAPEEGPGKRGTWKNMPPRKSPSEMSEQERKAAEDRQKQVLRLYPMGRPDRMGKPEDVANMVAYFASELAYYVTGQIISTSGGFSRAG